MSRTMTLYYNDPTEKTVANEIQRMERQGWGVKQIVGKFYVKTQEQSPPPGVSIHVPRMEKVQYFEGLVVMEIPSGSA